MIRYCILVALALAHLSNIASAGYLIEIDTDGLDDGIITLNDDFFYDFDSSTTTASQSAPSRAFGMTGGDSIFGGNGFPDTYSFFYSPDSQPDNIQIPAETTLSGSEEATGLTGGGPGTYRVFATWPFTENVGGGLTEYTVNAGDETFTVEIDQNGKGHEWIALGDILYTDGEIEVFQAAGEESFVSMRAAGILFELQPEVVPCEPNGGDFDGNGQVEFADFLLLSSNFGGAGDATMGDADCNGQIEFADFLLLSSNFGQPAATEAVPEPRTTFGTLLLTMAALASSTARKRR